MRSLASPFFSTNLVLQHAAGYDTSSNVAVLEVQNQETGEWCGMDGLGIQGPCDKNPQLTSLSSLGLQTTSKDNYQECVTVLPVIQIRRGRFNLHQFGSFYSVI